MAKFVVTVTVGKCEGCQQFEFEAKSADDALRMAKSGRLPLDAEITASEVEVQSLEWEGVTADDIEEVE